MEKLSEKTIEWLPFLILFIFILVMGAIAIWSLNDSLQREAESGIMKKELSIRKEEYGGKVSAASWTDSAITIMVAQTE